MMKKEMEEEEEGSSPTLPTETIEEILSRLPVKSLMRFRCVSKQWRRLFIDPAFITKHLKRSTEKNPTHILVSHRDGLYNSEIECGTQTRGVHFVFAEWQSTIVDIEASCDGLVCLTFGEEMGLFNPATKEFLLLPEEEEEDEEDSSYCDHSCFGLGFDPITKKYKLVKVTDNDDRLTSVDIYTIGSHGWRRILHPLPFKILHSFHPTVTVSGASHWVAISKIRRYSSLESILSFDFQHEEFQEVPLPEFGLPNIFLDLTVGVLGGCLSVSPYNLSTTSIGVWVMKEYGVKESWTKLFSIRNFYTSPLGFSKDGEILLQKDRHELILYNPETKTEMEVTFHDLPCIFYFASLVESLICLRVESEGTIKSRRAENVRDPKVFIF